MIFDEKGELVVRGRQLKEDLVIADLDVESVFRARLHDPRWRKETYTTNGKPWSTEKILISESSPYKPKPVLPSRPVETYDRLSEVYDALVMGTQDYIRKNGFKKVVIGLSGGIDSAIVAAIAVDALGKENVTGVSMPSRYSSPGSISDARLLAGHLDIQLITVPIEKAFKAYLDMLSDAFTGTQSNVTEENIQARIRGNIKRICHRLHDSLRRYGWWFCRYQRCAQDPGK